MAIENNSLTLKQVTDIIEGKHVLGAPDEIQEVKNAIESIAQCDAMGDSTLFIEFMLECLLNAMENYEEDEEEVQDKVQDKIQDKFPEVGHTTWDVLDIIRERPKSTVNDICSQLNLKERQVYKHISQLKKLGIIVRVGSNKTGYWKVNID